MLPKQLLYAAFKDACLCTLHIVLKVLNDLKKLPLKIFNHKIPINKFNRMFSLKQLEIYNYSVAIQEINIYNVD